MNENVCVWCGAPAETSHHVTDITTHPRRDYKRHFCYRCEDIENSIYERMERKYGEVHTDELHRRVRRALKRRGITPSASSEEQAG